MNVVRLGDDGVVYRVKVNLPKKVLRILSSKLSYLNEISTAYQQLQEICTADLPDQGMLLRGMRNLA